MFMNYAKKLAEINQVLEVVGAKFTAPWYVRAYIAVCTFFQVAAFIFSFLVAILVFAPILGLLNGVWGAVTTIVELDKP